MSLSLLLAFLFALVFVAKCDGDRNNGNNNNHGNGNGNHYDDDHDCDEDDKYDDDNDCSIALFERYVGQTLDQVNVTATIFDVVDVNHTKATSTGLYTRQRILRIQADALVFYLEQYGLNFSAGVPVPPFTGIALPNALFAPYGVGIGGGGTHHIAFDSAHCSRGKKGNWIVATFGQIVQMIGSGVFTSGRAAGQVYHNGDVLLYAEANFLKQNTSNTTWLNPRNREIVQTISEYPTLAVNNSQGFIEQHSKVTTYSDADGVGFAALIITITKLGDGTTVQKNRMAYTWENDC
jgi:hypothetical protein